MGSKQEARIAHAIEKIGKLKLPDSIIVTSSSTLKVNAVRKLLSEAFPGRNLSVEGVRAASNIDEQPVGRGMTERGARNRIQNAEKEMRIVPRISRAYISIENGIFGNDITGWYDKALVVIKINGRTYTAISEQKVRFPTSDVKKIRTMEGGFKQHTVGSTLAQRYEEEGAEMDPKDPHSTLTAEKKHPVTREGQITNALIKALLKAAG